MNLFFKIVFWVLHPFLAFFLITVAFVSYNSLIFIQEDALLRFYSSIFSISYLFPMLSLIIIRKIEPSLQEKYQLGTYLIYLTLLYFLIYNIDFVAVYSSILTAMLLLLSISYFVFSYLKLNIHSLIWAGAVGIIYALFNKAVVYNYWIFPISVMILGFVSSAILYSKKSKTKGVYLSILIGFVIPYFCVLWNFKLL